MAGGGRGWKKEEVRLINVEYNYKIIIKYWPLLYLKNKEFI